MRNERGRFLIWEITEDDVQSMAETALGRGLTETELGKLANGVADHNVFKGWSDGVTEVIKILFEPVARYEED